MFRKFNTVEFAKTWSLSCHYMCLLSCFTPPPATPALERANLYLNSFSSHLAAEKEWWVYMRHFFCRSTLTAKRSGSNIVVLIETLAEPLSLCWRSYYKYRTFWNVCSSNNASLFGMVLLNLCHESRLLGVQNSSAATNHHPQHCNLDRIPLILAQMLVSVYKARWHILLLDYLSG